MPIPAPLQTAANCLLVTHEQNIVLISLNNPPVNALSAPLKQSLLSAITAAEEDPAVKGIVLLGEGKHFCAGADIKEFGKPSHPMLSDVCNAIENCVKPIISAINGACLGGGLELALATHYRVAASTAKFAFPEVNLGLIPGAGGTQRAPRLIGAKAALALMLSGRSISASQAQTEGLIDQLVTAETLVTSAISHVERLLASPTHLSRSCEQRALENTTLAAQEIASAQKKVTEKPGQLAQQKIIDAIQAAVNKPFTQGLANERAGFVECLNSPQRSALVHAFLAEKACAKVPELNHATAVTFKQVAVIGAGTMGIGICISLLDAGFFVQLIERDQAALEQGRERIHASYQRLQERQRMSAGEVAERLARLTTDTDLNSLNKTDLVIEAVFEDMQVKKSLLSQLDRICRHDCIIASNTSYLDIDEMADVVSYPQRVIGIHFFSPANIMKLVEVVVASQTDSQTVASAFALATALKKTPVRSGLADGFIGNRMLAVYREAVELMMLDGASPFAIDEAIRSFGFAMGPFEVVDLAGGDISWATRKRKAAQRDPRLRYVSIADTLCERSWFGQKTGCGYYLYEKGSRQGRPNPEVNSIIEQARRTADITPQSFSRAEIIQRYLSAMINEGANVLDQGIALRPLDIDVVLLNGYGFPRFQGGPMWYADHIGLERVVDNIKHYAKQDPLFWQLSPLLERMIISGQSFADLNHT